MQSQIISPDMIGQNTTVLLNPFSQDVANQIVIERPTNSDYKASSISGKQIDFNIPTSSFAIDVQNSCFEYTMQFTYHMKPSADKSAWVVWLINGKVMCQEFVTTASVPAPVGSPKMIGTCPIHAMNIIQSVHLNGMGHHQPNENKHSQALYYAAKVSGESGSKNLQTWFFSDNEYNPVTGYGDAALIFDGRPQLKGTFLKATEWLNGTNVGQGAIDPNFSLGPIGTAGQLGGHCNNYSVTVYKRFQVPLNLLTDAFSQTDSNLFQCNALQGEFIKLTIGLRPWDLSKVMGPQYAGLGTTINGVEGHGFVNVVSDLTAAGLFNSSMLTGNQYASYMKDCRLVLQTKQGAAYTQQLRSRSEITNRLQTYQVAPIKTLATNETGSQDIQITAQHQQVQDIMPFFQISDEQAEDSVKLHGLGSMYCAKDLCTIVNSTTSEQVLPFIYDLQMQIIWGNRQSMPLVIKDTGIKTFEGFRDMSLQSLRLFENQQNQPSPMFGRHWKLFNHSFILNVESLRNNDMQDNVVADGLDMRGNPLAMRWTGICNYTNTSTDGAPGAVPQVAAPWAGTAAGPAATDKGMVALFKYYKNNAALDTGIEMKVLYIKESWQIIKPQENRIIITEKMEDAVMIPIE